MTTNLLNAQMSPENLLLKNYKPKSICHTPKTIDDKEKFPVIDMHSHPYAESPEIIDQWVKNMVAVGIEKTIILTKAIGSEFDSVFAAYTKYPGRFDVWCGLFENACFCGMCEKTNPDTHRCL